MLQPTDSHSDRTIDHRKQLLFVAVAHTSGRGRGDLSHCWTRSLEAPSQPTHDHIGTTVGASHKHRRTRSWRDYGADTSIYRHSSVSLSCIYFLVSGEVLLLSLQHPVVTASLYVSVVYRALIVYTAVLSMNVCQKQTSSL